MADTQTNNATNTPMDTSAPTLSISMPSNEPVHKAKKKSNIKALLVGLFLLLITLPLTIFFVQQQLEIRSRAGDQYKQCLDGCAKMEKSDAKQACKNDCEKYNKPPTEEIPASNQADCSN